MKHDSVIFDLDGTLLDTLGDLCSAVNATMRKYSYPERTLEEVRTFVGNGVRVLVEKSMPEGSDEEMKDRVLADFKAYYAEHNREKTAPYPGIIELLEKLRGENVPCAVVSNKIDPATKALTAQFFGDRIQVAIGEREGIERKPAPDSVFEAMKLLSSENPVYVGDSEVDVQTAKNAGIDGVFVTWGFRTAKELEASGAETCVSSVNELWGLL